EQAGPYSVVVSNAYGVKISPDAILTVSPLMITAQPRDVSLAQGASATFSVTAAGPEPFRYQWQHNAQDLVGQTERTLLLTNVQTSQAGFYSVLVSNNLGSVQSDNALLSVGQVVVWGQAGALTNFPLGLTNVVAIAGAMADIVALKSDGTVIGWGNGIPGQVTGSADLTNAVAVGAGGGNTAA